MTVAAGSAGWQEDVRRSLHRVAREDPMRTAVIDARGVITSWRTLRAGALRWANSAPRRPEPVGGVTVVTARPDAGFFMEVLGDLMAGRTPLVLPRQVPPGLATGSASLVHRGRKQGCLAWKAVLTVVAGRQIPVVSHGESPCATRKALALGMVPEGRTLLSAPLHLAGPLEFAVRQLLSVGSVVVLPSFSPTRWVEAASSHCPDWAFLVPTQLQQLFHHCGDAGVVAACHSLRRLVYSSAPCPPDLAERLSALLGPKAVEYYGTALYDGTLASPGAEGGKPLPSADLRIVDSRRRPVPPGQAGEVEGRSLSGLITHPAGSPCNGKPSWQGVGDRGRLAPGGLLQITEVATAGRAIVAGVKVSLAVTREAYLSHPGVSGCTVTAKPDTRFGAVLAATVETPRADLTAQELRAWGAARLTPPQRPHTLEVCRVSS